MALHIESIDELPPKSAVIIYDIEAIGSVSEPSSCFMWNLSAMLLNDQNIVFDQYIRPPVRTIPNPPHPKLFKVTHDFLRQANASPCSEVLNFFFKWINNLYSAQDGGYIVLVSHGNFRFDQPLFQTEILRNNIKVPENVFFLDTLHWYRSIHKKLPSYSLNSLYKNKFKKNIKNAHLSLFDVYALSELVLSEEKKLSGIIYKMFHTSLLQIPSVGLFTERILFDQGISSVEHLVFKYRNECTFNKNLLHSFLVKHCQIIPSVSTSICDFICAY